MKAIEIGDVVMVTYNPSNNKDHAVIDRAVKLNKGVLIKKVLNSGHDCISTKAKVAKNLRFALGHQGVSSVIVGTISAAHLKANSDIVKSMKV